MEDDRCRLWVGADPMLERAPLHPTNPCQAGNTASSPHRPRDPHSPRGGTPPQTDQSPGATLALVVGTRPTGPGNHLARLCCPLLDRTHLSLLQTGPQVDDAQIALDRKSTRLNSSHI